MSGSTTTRIDGPVVYLEVPGQEHLPAIWKVYLEAPDYFEALSGSAEFDPVDIEMMYEEAISAEDRYYFGIRRSDTKALIGTVEVEAPSSEDPAILHGMVIAQAERGHGYGRAALELLESFLEEEHGVTALAAQPPRGYDDGERFLAAMGFRRKRVPAGEVQWMKRLGRR